VLLAIDTSSGTSVAVVDRDRGILADITEPDTRRHAEIVGTLIQDCLRESGVAPAELSGVAVGMGPGPFTGLRVGIAAGRAFAFGAGKPVVPVVSHDAIALGTLALATSAAPADGDSEADLWVRPGLVEPLLVVTDARRREVYWSAYSGADAQGLPVRVEGPGLLRPEELPTQVPGFDGYRRFDASTVSAGAIGLLAERLFLHGRPFAGPDALYLRSPDVTLSAGPKRVS
jgi:tRNA threonylcarbamoyl adenosine modification protein YeaZ